MTMKTKAISSPTPREFRALFDTHSVHDAWMEIVQRHGKTFRYKGLLTTSDPALVKTLLLEKVHTNHRSNIYRLFSKIPGAKGLVFLEGSHWQKSVQAAMPILRQENISQFPEFIHQTTLTFAERWQAEGHLEDLYMSLTELGAGIMLKVSCGLDPQHELSQALSHQLIQFKMQTTSPNPNVRPDQFDLDASNLRHLHHIVWDIFTLHRRFVTIQKLVRTFFDKSQSTSVSSNNYLQNLKRAGFSLPEIASQFNHLYGAFNAVDYSITCALYLLSQHNEWILRLRSEFSEVLEGETYPSFQHFPQLVQTMCFMKEVFRMYPATMAVSRRTGEPIQYKGDEIPVGTEVLILLYALHHHPEFWLDPGTFNPDRWASPTPYKSYAYIPFLEGPRQCLGRHWATLNFVVILHALLTRCDFNILKSKVEIDRYLVPRFSEKIPCQVSLQGV